MARGVEGLAPRPCRQQPAPAMAQVFEVRHVSVSVRRVPADVYAFVVTSENLPRWAVGLGTSYREEGDVLVADGPLGEVRVRFVEKNRFGVLDHVVTLPSGDVVHNAMRVVPNGDGSEVTFMVVRQPGMTDDAFEADVAAVARDLEALRSLLEE